MNDNISDFAGMPNWAKKAWIIEPKGLKIIDNESTITKYDFEKYMTDSVTATYSWDKDEILKEARRIAKELNIEINFDEDWAFNSDWTINNDYSVYVYTTWIDNEKLVVNISNMKQLDEFTVERK